MSQIESLILLSEYCEQSSSSIDHMFSCNTTYQHEGALCDESLLNIVSRVQRLSDAFVSIVQSKEAKMEK